MAEESHANPFGPLAAQWMESWRAVIGAGAELSENWSNSMLPFIMKRAAESGFGMGQATISPKPSSEWPRGR